MERHTNEINHLALMNNTPIEREWLGQYNTNLYIQGQLIKSSNYYKVYKQCHLKSAIRSK